MSFSLRSQNMLRRLLIGGRGRPMAALLLALLLLLQLASQLPSSWLQQVPPQLAAGLAIAGAPLAEGRDWLFDSFQKLLPRQALSQPVTIVAIDEKSLRQVGQWPWPRDRLAALIGSIQHRQPAVLGLDIYMPEADQSSPDLLAARLPASQHALADQLRSLPGNDRLLAQALAAMPTVLGAAGFDFRAYTTSSGMRSVPLRVMGDDPRPFVRHYPQVLASLPQLQAAASGQALLSVDAHSGGVRRIAMIATVGEQLVPGLALEMFRVGTGDDAIRVTSNAHGVASVRVAELDVPTQSNGDIYLHFARQADGMARYVSAVDVMQGRVDTAMLAGKLVLLGLTGSGLNDMRYTALQELVPGIEIQAQVMEALYDGSFLQRPWWFLWAELAAGLLLGINLLWHIPRGDSGPARWLRQQPQRAVWLSLGLALLAYALGLALFHYRGLLLDVSAIVIELLLLLAVLLGSSILASLSDARIKLAGLVESGLALGRLQQRDLLLQTTLQAACEMAYCEGAAVLLPGDDNILRYTLHTYPHTVPADTRWQNSLPEQVLTSGKSCQLTGLAASDDKLEANTYELLRQIGIEADSLLVLPMKAHENAVVGVILLCNACDDYSKAQIPFDPKLLPFMEALAAQAAVAMENLTLVEAQKALMESMIRVLAGAIDAKSPYTGGHCERVPELAFMLAEAACAAEQGPLADFSFRNEDEWREFRIGAWLHDCGKVTTPEYVVDKATKLETIYNRLHEVRTRFEVLLRDARIARLEAIYLHGADPAQEDARLAAREAQLQDDFAFVASCNQGGEFMAPERIERLQHIAAQSWWRHFDDRLGLSQEEAMRCTDMAAALPAREQLLADKVQHLFERPPSKALDPKYGFRLQVPHYLYNQGELYNLSVGRGTLTEEERFKINEHIIQTIVMLEQMPLPASLHRVPEYAGTHHETLTGSGYPRKLTAEALSIPARIMAIADIFEALTASDRPYKRGKTLSESVAILYRFKQDKHIDPVLFDLFLTSGIYRRYGERYLRPAQLDEVEISRYLGD